MIKSFLIDITRTKHARAYLLSGICIFIFIVLLGLQYGFFKSLVLVLFAITVAYAIFIPFIKWIDKGE